ncbi:MAG: RnfABCDGE type electron transport complex subunit G [bacterium]|nr:RnfABCDGE type electron transport complex subunit G [bacterium]MDY4098834.1 RnfABCDGE type electron transport complex subunit G [Lachnospiraceae bacterium]
MNTKKIVHDAVILTAFTLVLGFLLGLVYEVTKKPIADANNAAAQAAYKEVFADADSFEALDGFDKAAATDAVVAAGYTDSIDDIQVAKDASGAELGYVITVTAKDASQSTITFSVGIKNDGTVNGYSITSIAETPGLGMKVQEESFYSQFRNKLVDAFTVVKNPPAADNEIEAISGATISSKAMANGVNAALTYFRSELGGAQ